MQNFWTWFILAALAFDLSLASPAYKDLNSKTKKGGSRGGFYSSRFGSVYDAKDFTDEPTTAAPLREAQVPTGVAGPHQQNIDEDIKSEVPNIEELTTPSLPTVSEDLHLGVKGGIKGYKNPIRLSTEPPAITPIRVAIEPSVEPTIRSNIIDVTRPPLVSDNLTKKKTKGIKGGTKGYQYEVKNIRELFTEDKVTERIEPSVEPTIRSDIIDVTRPPLVSDNLTKKKTKGIKGGTKGYHYDVKNIRNLFSEDRVSERSFEVTTVESYNPSILNLPTERRTEEVTAVTTENYRQETVAPVQQTEEPFQQTEIPVQQTEEPIQQTEIPVQQTEEPIRETEPTTQRPIPTTFPPVTTEQYEPVQDTQSPIEPQVTERPELPVQSTVPPVTTEQYEPVQDTQSPIEPQVTERPELPVQTTVPPPTTEYYNEQQTEIPQVTLRPEEPFQVTEIPTTQLPTTSDEFSKYPLGLDGSFHTRGGGSGKGKGAKGNKGSKGGKGWKKQLNVTPSVAVLSRGSSGVSSRRAMNPATPLLPSLRGYEG